MSSLLQRDIQELADEAGAVATAASYYDYASQTSWSYRGDRWFHAASTIKVAVLVGLFAAIEEGRFSLDHRLHVRNRFLSVEDGNAFRVDPASDSNGDVQAAVGKQMRIRMLAHHMIATSSNLATNLLLELVGVEYARAALQRMGISGVELRRGVEDEAAFAAGINNRATANGLAALFRLIEDRQALSGDAADAMLEILHKQEFRSGIPAGVPETLRPEAQFAHKTGEIATVNHDAGIVYLPDRPPYVVAILTEWERGAGNRKEAVASISRLIFDHLVDANGDRS